MPETTLLPQFLVRTARHPRFERRGADLHLNATISLVDALVGFTSEVSAVSAPAQKLLLGR